MVCIDYGRVYCPKRNSILTMQKEFWNSRYKEEAYAYGIEPNEYVKQELEEGEGKSVLFPCEGEGRNAVYAAKLGWRVYAFDYSLSGKEKAMNLADKAGVSFEYDVCSFEAYRPTEKFDAVVLSYAHISYPDRAAFHKLVVSWLKPEGRLIVEGFSKSQLGLSSGGPKDVKTLLSVDELNEELKGIHFDYLEEVEVDLTEGKYHVGKGMVIRGRGRKK